MRMPKKIVYTVGSVEIDESTLIIKGIFSYRIRLFILRVLVSIMNKLMPNNFKAQIEKFSIYDIIERDKDKGIKRKSNCISSGGLSKNNSPNLGAGFKKKQKGDMLFYEEE